MNLPYPLTYVEFLINFKILIDNPVNSFFIYLCQGFIIILSLNYILKTLFQAVSYSRLKGRFNKLEFSSDSFLHMQIKLISQKLQQNKIPEIYEFSQTRPLIYTAGIIKPSIFISCSFTDKLSQEELQTVLAHELNHIKRKDALWLKIFEFSTLFFPVFTVLVLGQYLIYFKLSSLLCFSIALFLNILILTKGKALFVFLREITCDDNTVSCTGDPLLLASTLIKVWKIGRELSVYNYKYSFQFISSIILSPLRFNSRIKRLINYKKPVFTRIIEKSFLTGFSIILFVLSSFLVYTYSEFKDIKIEKTSNGLSLDIRKDNSDIPGQKKQDIIMKVINTN